MDVDKKQFLQQVQNIAVILANMDHHIDDIDRIWNARLYGPGAENAFTQAEMDGLQAAGLPSCTPDELYAFVILCAQLKNFFHNGAVVASDYASTIARVRTDI